MSGELKVFGKRPYYDDYDENKKFLQILFRPSLAVQARELTQMQTILQNQISRIGSHFFDNGARIINGETKYYRSIQYIKLDTDPSLTVTQLESLIGTTIKKTTGNLEAKIIHFELSTNTDPFTLYVEYVSGDGGTDDRFVNGDIFTLSLTNADSTALEVGDGSLYSVNSGIYYINSRFVLVDRQTIVIDKYSPVTSNVSVGFLIEDKIVTPDEDNSLFDNAIGSTNENAPGATRYKMIATLAVKPEGVSNFVEIVNIQAGEPTTNANLTDYTKVFQEIFARRTYDESGDYIVNDFLLDVQEYYNNGTNRGKYNTTQLGLLVPPVTEEIAKNRISLTLDAGKAYVRGYEIETLTDSILYLDKARTTLELKDEYASVSYRNQITVTLGTGVFTTEMFLDSLNNENIMSLRNSSNVELYSAKAIYIKNSGQPNKYDIVFRDLLSTNSSSKLSNVAKVVFPNVTNMSMDVVLPASENIISDSNDSVYLFKLPYSVVSTVSKVIFDIYSKSTITTTNAPVGTTLLNIPDMDSSDEGDYVVLNGSNIISVSNANTTNKTIELSSNTTVPGAVVLYKNNVNNLPIIKKTKTPATLSNVPSTDFNSSGKYIGTGLGELKEDGYKLISIIDSNNIDITDRFIFDNGQTNTLYNKCNITLKQGQLHGTFPYEIIYEYFVWDTDEGYCTVDSYTRPNELLGITLEEIYDFNGQSLGDYVDFRRKSSRENYAIADDGFFITDFKVYLPRKDKIILDKNKNFVVLSGIPSLTPELPKDAEDSITLYELNIPAYTFNILDIEAKKLNYRRYTMKDISNIERRVESLEYYTALSLLENDINNKNYIDKFKSGFLVDNFDTFTPSQNDSTHYKVALDFDKNQLRPQSMVSAIDMGYDSGTGIRHHSDGIVTLNYTTVKMAEQPFATKIERIQPFIKYTWEGNIKLDPPFDNWVTTEFIDTTLDLGTGVGASQRANDVINQIFNSPSRIFTGTPVGTVVDSDTSSSTQQIRSRRRLGRGSRQFATTTTTTQTQFAGSRVVDVSAIPFIRSRLVEFIGTGFKPNTKVIPYFENIDVTDYCAIGIDDFIESSSVSGQIHTSISPDNEFITAGDGQVKGYFYIPNNQDIRFKTGNRKFELKDVKENSSTFGEAIYTANGTHTTIQNTFVTTRQVTTSTFWSDPIAQSFTTDTLDGAFVTGIKLYFTNTLDTNEESVTIQIRSMSNGTPTSKIVTSKTLTAQELKNIAIPESHTVDTVTYQFRACLFGFNSPVYLESNNEYAFVVLTNSETLSLWTCVLGQQDVITGNYVNKQPYLGSMFKSQNNTTWTVDQLQDIKFEIYKANFNTNGQLILHENVTSTDINTEADPFVYIVKDNLLSYNTSYVPVINGGSGYSSSFDFDMVMTNNSIVEMTVVVSNGEVVSVNVKNNNGVYGIIGGVDELASYNNFNAVSSTTKAVLDFKVFNKIKVNHYKHGFKDGDVVVFKDFVDPVTPIPILDIGFYNALNRTNGFVVQYVNMDTYYISNPMDTIAGNSTKELEFFSFGKSPAINAKYARISQIVEYSQVKLLTDSIILNGTLLQYQLYNYNRDGTQSSPYNLTEQVLNDLGGLFYIDNNNAKKARLVIDFSSNSSNISPVIDVPRVTLYAYSNRFSDIIDSTTNNGITYQTYTAESRYLTKNIKLVNPSNLIELYIDLNLPSSTYIEVYAKTAINEITVEDNNQWQKLNVDRLIYSEKGIFNEHKFTLGTSDFTNYMIKILFLQQENVTVNLKRANPPIIEKLRVIALSQ